MDNRGRGPGPLLDRRDIIAKGGVIHFVDEDTEESSGVFVWVGLELGVDFDDEGGSHCREQTRLTSKLARVRQAT